MPPLYGEEQSPNQNQQNTNLQTHSNKFPIEREVVLTSIDKNNKIPILNEYKQRAAGRVAIAPDAPIKQQAWIQEANLQVQVVDQRQDGHPHVGQNQEIYSSVSTGAVPRIPKSEEDRSKSLSKTYHTIKEMISSRFGPSRKDIEPEIEVSLNNVTEELRKSNKSIDEDEAKKKESIYGKAKSHDTQVTSMKLQQQQQQHFTNNTYNQQYNHTYYQSSSTQQNAILPGQHQTNTPIQPSLPGQSAQLHVSHITPPAGVQTVHQTQVSPYNPQIPGRNEYVIQTHSGIPQLQNPPLGKHGLPMQPVTNLNQNYPASQQLIHQSPRFSHNQHVQNMHQRQLIQQMQQQQQQQQQQQHLGASQPSPRTAMRTQQQQQFPSGLSYQQYQQARQTISRSQIDLPSTSRQTLDTVRMMGQEMYYHYNKGRPGYSVQNPQVYVKQENNQESELQHKRFIEKAVSQPQLCYGDQNKDGKNNSMELLATEKYEITVEERITQEFVSDKNQEENHQRLNQDFRPDTSLDNRKDEMMYLDSNNKELHVQKLSDQEHMDSLEKKDLKAPSSGRIIEDEKKDERSKEMISDSADVNNKKTNVGQVHEITKKMEEINYQQTRDCKEIKREDLEHRMARMKIQNQGSGSDYDKPGQSSSNVDSGRGSAVYSSGRRPPLVDQNHQQARDTEWVDIVESELRSILEPSRDISAMAHSTLSESVSSVTPPLPPLSPHGSPRTPRNRYSSSLPYGAKPTYNEYGKSNDKRNFQSSIKHRATSSTMKKDSQSKKFSHLFGVEAADLTSTTTGLDLDSMLDRSDSDLSTNGNDARTIRKQLEGLENMYSEVLKLLGGSVKKRRKTRGLTSYGSVSSLPTSSVSSRPIARHHDKRRSHAIDERIKKAKDVKSINKRFQRLESHVVTLARSVAHLSSEMRTQHLMIQEMENIRGEISALRTQTNMVMVRSQSQPLIKDAELPALSNPSRVKKLTKFFGTEPPLIRLFLRELGYEKYAAAFEKEKVGMVELPYLSEERLQKMGIPLGPRLRILQEARISVCKDPIYVV
ncbi:myb-like protein P isoform X2 [Chelonus insularis]|nr:myb-like protein P isoform X2 [Chelonus insularis]